MNSFTELTDLIDVYAGSVGLRRSSLPGEDGGEGARIILWGAPYAQLMFWRLQMTGKKQISCEVQKAQERLDTLLVSAEKRFSGVVDGYLLLFLENEPDEDLRNLIRLLELDTSVCRKSFIWPREGNTPEARWQRLWRTTVIGLPESPYLGKMVDIPVLKEAHKEIWKEIRRSGSANAALKVLKECKLW